MMVGQKYQKSQMSMVELMTTIEMMELIGVPTEDESMMLWRKTPRMPQTEIANSLTLKQR